MFTKTLLASFVTLSAVSAAEKPLVMVRYTVKDVARNGGQPLGTLLVPQGWNTESNIEWTLASIYFPFAYSAKYTRPDGGAALEVLPVVQGRASSSPFGSEGNAGPRDVLEGLKAIAQKKRPNAKMKVLKSEASKLNQEAGANGSSVYHQTGVLVVAYTEGEREFVEEFAGSLYVSASDMQGYATRYWAMHGVWSIRAWKAEFESVRAIGTAMLRSAKPSAEFLKAIEVASQCFVNIVRNDRDARAREQALWLQTMRDINDTWRKTCEERWAMQDRQNEQFRDLLGNVNRFVNPSGDQVLLPTSHTYAWEGPNGTYILTNDPSYRPDADFSGTWNKLKPKN